MIFFFYNFLISTHFTNEIYSRFTESKDPGIPNLWPFKENLLNKIEQQKRKVEEEKNRQKEARHAKFDKNRNINFTSLANDASKRDEAFEKEESSEEEDDGSFTQIDLGTKDNSRKAYYKEFRKVIDAADVILEVLDARDPLGCRTKEVEKMILDSELGKKIILVLNKIDLVPKENVVEWLAYLRKEYPTVAFKSSTQKQRNNLGHHAITKVHDNIASSSECFGASTLVKLLKNYSRNRDIKTSITVGIVGFPNVGKSSIINSLKRSKVCGVGATPGLTKSIQEIRLDKNVKLLDCPGIIFNKDKGDKNAEILLRNFELIVSRCTPQQLIKRYNVPMFTDTNEFLIDIARQRGKLRRGGIPCVESAARIVLQDWNSGKIPYYTTPPAISKIINSEIVTSWGKEFNLDEVCNETEDKVFLDGLKSKNDFGGAIIMVFKIFFK
ncbi:2151_t:CDS:2 [Diversispora eburnea]|uniref:2151_t:CDS:1 n=1 Tax=Diversispora eburnea TaxID=1213867 RepID=A0A9N9B4Y1_9GLOM|nr:2151_t:CDS:2 [Diversispora eburnea]